MWTNKGLCSPYLTLQTGEIEISSLWSTGAESAFLTAICDNSHLLLCLLLSSIDCNLDCASFAREVEEAGVAAAIL